MGGIFFSKRILCFKFVPRAEAVADLKEECGENYKGRKVVNEKNNLQALSGIFFQLRFCINERRPVSGAVRKNPKRQKLLNEQY